MSYKCVNVSGWHRICKEEVIADFEREVKKIKEMKLYTSRQPGFLQQMETFLLVRFFILGEGNWGRSL